MHEDARMLNGVVATRRALGALVFVTALIATLIGVAPAGAITNGQTDGDRHPYVVALVDDWLTPGYVQRFCTGSLVAPRLVVTAAHCLLGLVDSDIWVGFESVYRPNVTSVIHGTGYAAVDPAIFRGEFGTSAKYGSSELGNDIAVVHLDEVAPVDRFAQLPPAGLLSTLDLKSQTFTAVGFGRTRLDRTRGPNGIDPNVDPDLRNVSVESFRSLQSSALTLSQNPATGDGGICNGDSGGPHFLGDSDVMVAITTFADIACRSLGRHYRVDIPFAREFLASLRVCRCHSTEPRSIEFRLTPPSCRTRDGAEPRLPLRQSEPPPLHHGEDGDERQCADDQGQR